MGTRCLIGIELPNNDIKYISCEKDGYPKYVGRILYTYYKDRDLVEELISLGSLYAIDRLISPIMDGHHFYNPHSGVCIFYNRDNDDDLRIYTGRDDFFKDINKHIQYGYLYTLDNEWKFLPEDTDKFEIERNVGFNLNFEFEFGQDCIQCAFNSAKCNNKCNNKGFFKFI